MTPELRAHYWELERQLGLRQAELEDLEHSDTEGKTAAMQWRHDRKATLRLEIELLDKAWGYPPFIKDWTNLPASLPEIKGPAGAPHDMTQVSKAAQQRHKSKAQWNMDTVMEVILELGLDPMALKEKRDGVSSDWEIARDAYKASHRRRGQAEGQAGNAFADGWRRLRDAGLIKWRTPL